MRIPTYFLDTNVWSSLASEAQTHVAKRLRTLASKDRIRILGSGELLEEFAGVGGKNKGHFAAMLDLFWTCTNVLGNSPASA